MKKKTKHYFHFVVIVFAVLCWFSLNTSAAYGAYEALPTNYQTEFNPDTLAGYPTTEGTYVLATLVYNPGNAFRVYLPKGATKVSLRLGRLEQDAKIGAVVRMGQEPQCTYNIAPDEYYDLPWGSYDGTSVAALNEQDFQARNTGGAIWILSSATASSTGKWIYVKILEYESTVVGSVQFEVTVDAEAYRAWYDTYYDEATGNPVGESSSTVGSCDPVWAEGGAEGGGEVDTGGGGGYQLPDFPIPDPVDDPVDDLVDGQYDEGNNMYLSVDVGSGEGVISKTDFNSISSMILKEVKMVFATPPQGTVACYAAYLKDDDMYIAEKDLGGNIVFVRYRENDNLKSYDAAYNLESGNTYRCTAFESLEEMNSVILLEQGVLFACIVVSAEDGSAHGMVFRFDGGN